ELLARGARVNHLNLIQAIGAKMPRVVEALLAKGADPNELDPLGVSASALAKKTKQKDVAAMLKKAGGAAGAPKKQKDKLGVLKELDRRGLFPQLDNGYIYPAAARLHVFRDGERWAIVIETLGYEFKAPDYERFADNVYAVGNCLLVDQGSQQALCPIR